MGCHHSGKPPRTAENSGEWTWARVEAQEVEFPQEALVEDVSCGFWNPPECGRACGSRQTVIRGQRPQECHPGKGLLGKGMVHRAARLKAQGRRFAQGVWKE